MADVPEATTVAHRGARYIPTALVVTFLLIVGVGIAFTSAIAHDVSRPIPDDSSGGDPTECGSLILQRHPLAADARASCDDRHRGALALSSGFLAAALVTGCVGVRLVRRDDHATEPEPEPERTPI